jgi:hypothetical protein
MVVLKKLAEQPMEVLPTEDEDVVKEFTPHGADEALRKAILPRAAVAGTNGLHAYRPERGYDVGTEGSVAVEDQVLGRSLEGEGLAQLLGDPGSCGALRYAVPGDIAAPVSDDERT